MTRQHKQRLCRICKKRRPWKYKNCPPDVCKQCYHRHIWPNRPALRKSEGSVRDMPSASQHSEDLGDTFDDVDVEADVQGG